MCWRGSLIHGDAASWISMRGIEAPFRWQSVTPHARFVVIPAFGLGGADAHARPSASEALAVVGRCTRAASTSVYSGGT